MRADLQVERPDAEQWCSDHGGIKYFEVSTSCAALLPLTCHTGIFFYFGSLLAQVSAKDASNVDPAFGQVAVAAFEHFKQIKAQQEKEYLKSAASAKIDLNASVEGSGESASSSACC